MRIKEEMSDEDFINLISYFSRVRIKKEYLPLMYESPLIMETLELLNILSCNEKLNTEDLKKIREVFKRNFKYFSKSLTQAPPSEEVSQHSVNNNKYSKIKLFFSVLFFCLMLASVLGCVYSAAIFVPLLIIFSVGLILCTCLISVKSPPVEIIPRIIPKIDELYNRSKTELDRLKFDLNKLRSFFAVKYEMILDNVGCVSIAADEKAEDFRIRKKSVTFSPTLNQLNVYNIDSPESRSRANSYENNGNVRPKL